MDKAVKEAARVKTSSLGEGFTGHLQLDQPCANLVPRQNVIAGEEA
jgi:hypothetical protein